MGIACNPALLQTKAIPNRLLSICSGKVRSSNCRDSYQVGARAANSQKPIVMYQPQEFIRPKRKGVFVTSNGRVPCWRELLRKRIAGGDCRRIIIF